jgi:hypothetical protein
MVVFAASFFADPREWHGTGQWGFVFCGRKRDFLSLRGAISSAIWFVFGDWRRRKRGIAHHAKHMFMRMCMAMFMAV